jgi:hypothetical protein
MKLFRHSEASFFSYWKMGFLERLLLFNHESDGVRKSAALLAVRSLPAKRIKTILREYVGSENYRYYNVIHWLDLGASMRRDDARRVARAASS